MRKKRVWLATDMDGTVIPMEVNPQREEEITTFRVAVEADLEVGLAYVTGRDLNHALEGIERHRLPEPDILVCDVGTSVHHSTPTGFEIDQHYVRLMEEARGGLDIRDVRHEMANLPELLLQPDHRHTESKVSYHLTPGSDPDLVLASVREILDGLGGTLQAVCSVGAPHGTGLLDLLPTGVAKDFALRYLQDYTGVDRDSLVYAGDSGNDLAAMLTGFKAIVVGNASTILKEEVAARGKVMGLTGRIYFASEYYSAGVLEGCRHFGIL